MGTGQAADIGGAGSGIGRRTPIVVGVDPGGRWVGLVVRQGNVLLEHHTLTRVGNDDLPGSDMLRTVSLAVIALYEGHDADAVGIEGVQKPSPFMGKSGNVSFTNINGLLGTAMVFGAVLSVLPAIVVPPGGNGSAPMGVYPVELRPTRGKGAGSDKLRHERSAWDVAGTTITLLRRESVSA